MMLIGLAGATMERRDMMGLAIANAGLEMAGGPRRLARLAMCSPEPTNARDEATRGQRTRDRIDDMRGSPFSGAVLVHVLCEAEAVAIRDRGGEIWHVEGMPSDNVWIRLGDRMVTPTEGGNRHYLDAVEALSEMALASKRRPRVA